MRNILLSTIIWLIALSCFGQIPDRNNALSLNLGMSYIARQDLIFSPFIHSNFSFSNIGIVYIRESKLYQKVGLRYGNFNPMVSHPYDFTHHGETKTASSHIFNMIDLDYLIGKRVKNFGKSTLNAGGLFSMDVQVLNYVYGRIGNFGYYSSLGLGGFMRHQYRINEQSNITTTFQFPIVAWLARSPYLVNDDEFIENISSHSEFKTFFAFIGNGQFNTWNRLQSYDLDINYTYTLNEKWQLGASYLFEFIHSSQPRNLLSYRHSIILFTNFKF